MSVASQELDRVVGRVERELGSGPDWEEPVPITVPCTGVPIQIDRFGFDSAVLTPAHRATIARIAAKVAASMGKSDRVQLICVIGYTDQRGNPKYNERLGLRRAQAVEAALVAAMDNIQPGLGRRGPFGIMTFSLGAERPVVGPGGDPALNRRVAVHLNRVGSQPVFTGRGPIPLPMPDRPTAPVALALVQGCLNRVMGTNLPRNGVLGPGTRSALVAFQRRRKLPPTGTPTPDTLAALSGTCGTGLLALGVGPDVRRG